MTNRLITLLLFAGIVSTAYSCKTYYIPVESFKAQLSKFSESDLREVRTMGPFAGQSTYMAYPIDTIRAVDKKGNPVNIVNSPAIEVRITDTTNKKRIFYFDLIQFDGENIVGGQSRFIPSIKRTISVGAIKKIEVQNGGKKYHYVR
jgi:hypothetical protein